MPKFEYDLQEFKLVEKWSSKKQADKLAELRGELNAKGDQGWELLGLHSFDLVGGITGSNKGKITLTVWKRQIGQPFPVVAGRVAGGSSDSDAPEAKTGRTGEQAWPNTG